MSVSSFDHDAIRRALDDFDPDHEHFANLREGSVWTFVFSEATDETRGQLDAVVSELGQGWVRIPSKTSQEAFEEMEDFVEGMNDTGSQNLLFAALESRGAFRAFREFMLEHPEVRGPWEEFRALRLDQRTQRFLDSLSPSPAPTETESPAPVSSVE